MTTATATEIRRFTVGQHVDTGQGDYRWYFEVIKRTKCFVTLRDLRNGDEYRVGIKVSDWSGDSAEWAMPFGSYSMAPIVRAA
jgi:hypothetical protein